MYSLLRLFASPRSQSTDSNAMDPSQWQCGRNPSRARPHTRSHGDVELGRPLSFRPIHQFAPYPPQGLPPRTSTSSQHSLSHGNSFPRGSRRSNLAPQVGQAIWHPMSLSQGTSLGTTDGIHHPGSINAGFTPNVGAERDPNSLSMAGDIPGDWSQPPWNAAGDLGPFPIFTASSGFSAGSDGSSSIQQSSLLSSTTQGQIETCLQTAININVPHPGANPTGSPSNVGNTIQETEQVFCGHTPTNPCATPVWAHPFNEWLLTAQEQMSARGLGTPLLCRPIWVRVFGEWLQLHPQLSTVLPQCWNEVFDLWLQALLKPDVQGLDASHAPTHESTGSSVFSTSPPATANTPDVSSPCPAPPSRKNRKRNPNAISRLTVPEIQDSCRKNGVEEIVIARIATVFPDVVTREHLKLAGQPGTSAGDSRDHLGYMEFAERCMVSLKSVKKRRSGTGTGAGQVQRYHCKLCGPPKNPRWKNSKDLLDHVWDTHCNPQGDIE